MPPSGRITDLFRVPRGPRSHASSITRRHLDRVRNVPTLGVTGAGTVAEAKGAELVKLCRAGRQPDGRAGRPRAQRSPDRWTKTWSASPWSMPAAANPELFGADRIHPNGRGHQLMATLCADLLL